MQIERALSALKYLNPSCSRDEWIRIGMAAKAAGLSFEDFHEWSKYGGNYANEKDCRNAWNSFKESGGTGPGTLFYIAHRNGWQKPCNVSAAHYNQNNIVPINASTENAHALQIWEQCLPALSTHEYIMRKHGKYDGLRYYPSSEPPLFIKQQDVTGYLVVPCYSNNTLQTLQFIPPHPSDEKLNLTSASFNDGYFVVGNITNTIYICEGLGQAWAINKVSEQSAVVCFGAGRMMKIGKVLRSQYPHAHLIVMPDRGKEKQAAEIANTIRGAWVAMPSHTPPNYDANDYLMEYGENELRALLSHPVFDMPLSVIFAHELPSDFMPPDELVEGVLTIGDGSILYGDSNCGKTFFVIDLACAIARGVSWMGRRTEQGLVIYLAAESPASVKRRLQAYQKYHNVRVMNFAIVQSPINLFDSDADTNALIQLIHLVEKQYGQKAVLVIGDTLARLSAGANENAGQDMSLVVRHFDRIRSECSTHFMLIHHSGKNAAAGARGWSGIRAAVDTEVEVTVTATGRCAEITKQRDLGTKGIRIGFRLEIVTLGFTKWKSLTTSCVIMPAEAPHKITSKRTSEVGSDIIEYLTACNIAIKKADLIRHFKDKYTCSAVYRALKKLVDSGRVSDSMGYMRILVPTSAK